MTLKSFRIRKGQDGFIPLALFIFGTVTAIFCAPTRAEAAAGQHGAGFDLGQVLLMGDFSKNFSDSLGLGLTYSYEASAMFGLLANFHYSNHSNSNGTNTLTVKGFSPNLRVNLAYFDKLVVYSFGGFGLYKVDQKLGAATGSVLTLGMDLGTGFLLELDPHFQFGTSLGFHNLFGKSDSATISPSTGNGMNIGGTYLGIFLNVFYLF